MNRENVIAQWRQSGQSLHASKLRMQFGYRLVPGGRQAEPFMDTTPPLTDAMGWIPLHYLAIDLIVSHDISCGT